MSETLVVFLQGISAALSWVAGLIFLRFWRESRDALFCFFGVAFFVLALSWTLLTLIGPTGVARPYTYAVRFLAFLLIIAGMIQKNRAA